MTGSDEPTHAAWRAHVDEQFDAIHESLRALHQRQTLIFEILTPEERKALASDIKDIFTEAKSAGFDVRTIKQIIRLRKQEPAEIEEQETLLDIYRRALGM